MEQGGKRFRPLTAAATIIVLLAGCQQTLNMDNVRSAISDGVLEQVGYAVSEVQCPENVAVEAGASFECTAFTGEGGKLIVQVTQDDDQGNVTWEVVGSEGLLDLAALMEKVREAITQGVMEQLGLAISEVSCPESVTVETGATFECTARPGEGGKLIVQVTQDDYQGNVTWEVVASEGLLDLVALEEMIKTGLMEQAGVAASVECGEDKYRVAYPGGTFECTAQDVEGRQGTVTVTMEDNAGNVSWALN